MALASAARLVLASLSVGSSLAGQTVRGSVVRAHGRIPIVNASIVAKRAGGATTSDRLGRFSIRLGDLPDTLVVAAIGFGPDAVALTALPDQPLTIALADAPVVISDLIAVASADLPLDLASQNRWEMSIDAARSVPPAVETDVYRALALIPAASFTRPLSARPMIRGYDAQEVTTRIDGFEVLNLETDYDDQYLLVEARPVPTGAQCAAAFEVEADQDILGRVVDKYHVEVAALRESWKTRFATLRAGGGRAVIWGAGSKGVSFLTNLGLSDEVGYAVDINPYKTGKFMAGSGQEIVAPEFLTEYRPDLVVAMNSIYLREIRTKLDELGLHPELISA